VSPPERSRTTRARSTATSRRCRRISPRDAHVWNALLSRAPGLGDVRLIDWDAWRVDTATDDLAYMLAVHWFPDWRRRYERESLERYHAALVAGGLRDYAFDALWQDYRLSVMWQITTPMWQANHALAPVIWWNNLERSSPRCQRVAGGNLVAASSPIFVPIARPTSVELR
jgi:hypothetical protein